jgi:hypothetical protein
MAATGSRAPISRSSFDTITEGKMNQAQLAEYLREHPRLDLLGETLNVDDIVIFSGPVTPYGHKTASRLIIGKIVRHTEKGITLEIQLGRKSSWALDTYNTPYRAEKFLKLTLEEGRGLYIRMRNLTQEDRAWYDNSVGLV